MIIKFFNMFALWMFGRTLEYELGSQRFLTFYMVCGVGARGHVNQYIDDYQILDHRRGLKIAVHAF